MKDRQKLWNMHCLYNMGRYLFLRIENEYKNLIEVSGITLPQLRVLWIIKSFSGISLGEIARIGYWAPPTVTKMLQNLLEKGMVEEEEHLNKKNYKLRLTQLGEKLIEINKQGHNDRFPLYRLINTVDNEKLKIAIELLKEIAINKNDLIILTYIESLNEKELKFDYSKFSIDESRMLNSIVWFYNLLRIFVLRVEHEHNQYLLKYKLTYPQLRALWIIEAFPGLTSVQLSEIGFWAPSTANVVVKNLYAKDLVYKDKSRSKNALHLYISEVGEKTILADFTENQSKMWLNEEFYNINEAVIKASIEVLRHMNEILGNDKVEAYIEKTFDLIERRLLL